MPNYRYLALRGQRDPAPVISGSDGLSEWSDRPVSRGSATLLALGGVAVGLVLGSRYTFHTPVRRR